MKTTPRKPRLTQRQRDLQAMIQRLRAQQADLDDQVRLLRAQAQTIQGVLDELELRLNALKQGVLK